MKVVIIEDEKLSADHLQHLLGSLEEDIQVVAKLNSVARAYSWIISNETADLIFLDIELGDGNAFDLLDITKIKTPIIFTTAYNEFAIKAFRYNSIDYILKPIEKSELVRAIKKLKDSNHSSTSLEMIKEVLQRELPKQYKQRFLVKSGNQLKSIEITEISYFYSEDRYTQIVEWDGTKSFVDYSLEDLEQILNPEQFFRLNRKVFCSIRSVKNISSYFNGRLSIRLEPSFHEQIVVSREKVKPFKEWLDK